MWASFAVSAALRRLVASSMPSFGVGIMERSEAGLWGRVRGGLAARLVRRVLRGMIQGGAFSVDQ